VTGKQWLGVPEVAEILGVTTRVIHERTSRRLIPCRKLASSRRIVFERDEIDSWLEQGPELEEVALAGGGWRVKAVEA
jgi:predicted DNA-binding transcriptional regulator AlpA